MSSIHVLISFRLTVLLRYRIPNISLACHWTAMTHVFIERSY